MKKIIIFALVVISLISISCKKELDITEFKDDFGNYKSELKIEGVLQQDKPGNSIIRIIRTGVVTERGAHNNIDDDGDGRIDEFNEVLPYLQDSTATVKVHNLNSGEEIEFEYVSEADSVWHWDEEDDEGNQNTAEMVTYGAYKPVAGNYQIENFAQYKLEVYSSEFDQTITGTTTVYPAVEFIDTLHTFQDSIVTLTAENNDEVFWKSDLNVTAYYVTFNELFEVGEDEYDIDFLFSYKSSRDIDLTDEYGNYSIGRHLFWNVHPGSLLKMTVNAVSPEYGHYMFSELPLNDPMRSNLRDQNGKTVMGCFGTVAAKNLYIIFE